MYPRSLIQVTLQITAVPDEDATSGRPNQAASVCDKPTVRDCKDTHSKEQMLYLLPPLLNAAMLALLSTSISLTMTMTSVFLAVDSGGSIIDSPQLRTLENASSIHALAFSLQGELLMVQSEGSFDLPTWEIITDMAQSKCRDTTLKAGLEDVEMKENERAPLETLVRDLLEEKFRNAEHWRHSIR